MDWPRARRAVYAVHQRYTYAYSAPVSSIRQRLVMVPRERHGDQRLLEQELTVAGAEGAVLTWQEDVFGNRVGRMRATRVEESLAFTAAYRVERQADPRQHPGILLAQSWEDGVYLDPTALTAPDISLRNVAARMDERGLRQVDLAERVHTWAAQAITYQIGVTGVQTPAAMALHLGRGVCQDYAHMMLAVLRLVGIPARYVSGHLLGEGAPHAWVEALVDDANEHGIPEVLAFDPTHHRRAGLNYITVAVGRDYADIAPTSGTFVGPATGRLSPSKQAEIIEVEYEDGTVWTAARAAAAGKESAA
ncbi:MAG: transglutaminase family protein [Chloroflexi bacterium]|nr:transglutaminase family protein [Chloroflexota bacterium]